MNAKLDIVCSLGLHAFIILRLNLQFLCFFSFINNEIGLVVCGENTKVLKGL